MSLSPARAMYNQIDQILQDHIDRESQSAREVEKLLELNVESLTEADIIRLGYGDSLCPICLTSFLAITAEEEMALAMDSPAQPIETLGVAKLKISCGHVFCRKDITQWIRSRHISCPTCRGSLLNPFHDDDLNSAATPDLGPQIRLVDMPTSLFGVAGTDEILDRLAQNNAETPIHAAAAEVGEHDDQPLEVHVDTNDILDFGNSYAIRSRDGRTQHQSVRREERDDYPSAMYS